jgi:hypothetical protein
MVIPLAAGRGQALCSTDALLRSFARLLPPVECRGHWLFQWIPRYQWSYMRKFDGSALLERKRIGRLPILSGPAYAPLLLRICDSKWTSG